MYIIYSIYIMYFYVYVLYCHEYALHLYTSIHEMHGNAIIRHRSVLLEFR